MLNVNIITINGVEDRTRGMLLQTNDDEKIEILGRMLQKLENITVKVPCLPAWWTDWLYVMDAT